MSRRVYLDHNASTPVHPEVRGGDAAVLRRDLRQSRRACTASAARRATGSTPRASASAGFLRVAPDEIVFTSGGTESDNFGVKGLALARGRGHLITSKIEHHAVLRTCQSAGGARASTVTYLPRRRARHGRSRRRASGRSGPTPSRISIMHANSEVGHHPAGRAPSAPSRASTACRSTWTPCRRSARSTIDVDALRHRPAVVLRPQDLRPEGRGRALRSARARRWSSVQHGGEHERRRRAGTENVPGIVGLGKAVEIRARDMQEEAARRHGAARPAVGGHPGARARRAAQRPPDRAAAGHRQHLVTGTWSRNRSCSVWISRASPSRRARRAPPATSSRRTCWWRWACRSSGRWAPCARSLGRSTTAEDIDYVVESVEPHRPQAAARRLPVGQRREIQPDAGRSLPQPAQRRADARSRRRRGWTSTRAAGTWRASTCACGTGGWRGALPDLRLRADDRRRQRGERADRRARGGGRC